MAIRVLIVDDSPFAREVLCSVLSHFDDIEVVGQAGDGKQAEELVVEMRPDVVTMDVIMPMVGGIEAIRSIMAHCPTPIIVVSDIESDYERASLEALDAGAIDTFVKPKDGFTRENVQRLVELLRVAAAVRMPKQWHRNRLSTANSEIVGHRVSNIEFVGIIASTGGPQTLRRLVSRLQAGRFHPIAVVQHTSVGFTNAFVNWLAGESDLPVTTARDGQRVAPSTIAVAPDDCHLEIRPGGIAHLHRGPKIGGHRPSGTLLLNSLAASFGASAAGVVLSGMGDDGAEGARAIETRGGVVFAEDPQGAIIQGMPQATIAHTQNPIVASPEEIGSRLLRNNLGRGER